MQPRRGHFLYESGYHSDLWFDLETLCRRPAMLQPYVIELASKVADFQPQVICGPLVEGSFIALMVSSELHCEFTYTIRIARSPDRLFPVEYRLPRVLSDLVYGKRVVIVNDVISAGSAVRGTFESLKVACADVAGFASLVVLGDSFPGFAAQHNIPLETNIRLPRNNLWEPENCPLCAARISLEKPGN